MELLAKPSKRCIGRYEVSLPRKFSLNSEGGQIIDGVDVVITEATYSAFGDALAGRTAKLESASTLGIDQKYPMLKKIIPLPGGARGVVFDRAESEVSGGRLSRILELLAWKDGYTIIASIKATDTSFPEDKDDEIARQHLKTDVPEKLARLINIFSRSRGRSDTETPAEQGVCVLNGFVSGPPGTQEKVTVFYHLVDAPDVYFRISSNSSGASDDTVVDRMKNIEPLLADGEGKVIRKGRRDTNGMHASEIAYSVLSDEDLEKRRILTHSFTFEANAQQGNAKNPIITVDLVNGERKPEPERASNSPAPPLQKATLTENEVSSLWDAVIPTIQRSATAF